MRPPRSFRSNQIRAFQLRSDGENATANVAVRAQGHVRGEADPSQLAGLNLLRQRHGPGIQPEEPRGQQGLDDVALESEAVDGIPMNGHEAVV